MPIGICKRGIRVGRPVRRKDVGEPVLGGDLVELCCGHGFREASSRGAGSASSSADRVTAELPPAATAFSRLVRSGAPWHPRLVLTLAASIAAVLLGVFGYVLADSQATSRHEAEQRFLAQATTAAGLTKAIFSATVAPEVAAASAASYGGAVVDPRKQARGRDGTLEARLRRHRRRSRPGARGNGGCAGAGVRPLRWGVGRACSGSGGPSVVFESVPGFARPVSDRAGDPVPDPLWPARGGVGLPGGVPLRLPRQLPCRRAARQGLAWVRARWGRPDRRELGARGYGGEAPEQPVPGGAQVLAADLEGAGSLHRGNRPFQGRTLRGRGTDRWL